MPRAMIHMSGSTSDGRDEIGSGSAFELHEWTGGGPGYLHVHYEDDEAWHVISGRLLFRFDKGKEQEAGPGTTVFVPAGVAHDYDDLDGSSRYLMILTPRLRELIDELHATPFEHHPEVMKRYKSEIVE